VGTLPEEDVPLLVDDDPSPAPARATQLAAITAAANPQITQDFRIKKI